MKTKDQTLLEEAYKKVATQPFKGWFVDRNGESITSGDKVRHYKNDKVYTVVGGDINKNLLQLELIEDLPPGNSPQWVNDKPSMLVKVSE